MTFIRLITTTSKGTHCSFEKLPIDVNVLMLSYVDIALNYLILQSVPSLTLCQINILLKYVLCNVDTLILGYYDKKYE